MRYLILAQSKPTAHALGAWLELLGERPIEKLDDDQRVIVWAGRDGLPVAQAFERLFRALEAAAYGGGEMPSHQRVVVLVDGVPHPDDLNIVARGGGWESLLAMLILTFPEFRWVFGVWGASTADARRASGLGQHHSLVSLLAPDDSDPLFDSTRLRDWIREHTNHCLENELKDDLRLPLRKEAAAIIEEEQAYLYFNGYCAYRFGFRADLIASWQRMKNNFGGKGEPHPYWLLLEDMSLNFPDREKGVKLHCLQGERAHHCPQLDSHDAEVEMSHYRVLMTTGQTRPGDNALSRNRAYLREKVFGKGVLVLKPASGLFGLWEQAGLMRRHDGGPHLGCAPSYRWPLAMPGDAGKTDGHGAPGKLLLVAENLIERAEDLKSQVTSVADAVLGATMATDALELTGARTPTTAIEALALKHQFEVMAECQFSGVEYHIRIEPRIAEITRELNVICEWFGKGKRESANLNARMHILNQLVRSLRDHNQFDEEQFCINRARRIHNTLWVRQRSARVLLLPLLRYLELLLSSFATFVTVLLGWLVIFALLFWWVGSTTGNGDNWSFWCGLQDSISTFFSVGPPTHPEECKTRSTWGYALATSATIFAGFFHLGVFVSHLYLNVARR